MADTGMRVLAIDPGHTKSGWVVFGNDGRVHSCGIDANGDVVRMVRGACGVIADRLAIEMISSYGMPVGREVFQTCIWIGRYVQAWLLPDDVQLVERPDIKLELCGSRRAKDPHVRQALIDRLGKPGTKKDPGPTYGVSGDMWAALGVAVVATGFTKRRALAPLLQEALL